VRIQLFNFAAEVAATDGSWVRLCDSELREGCVLGHINPSVYYCPEVLLNQKTFPALRDLIPATVRISDLPYASSGCGDIANNISQPFGEQGAQAVTMLEKAIKDLGYFGLRAGAVILASYFIITLSITLTPVVTRAIKRRIS